MSVEDSGSSLGRMLHRKGKSKKKGSTHNKKAKKKKKNKNKDLATDAGGGAFAPEPIPIKHDVLASNQDIETVMVQSDCSREDAVEALVRCNFVIEDAMCLASASLTPEDWIAWTDT